MSIIYKTIGPLKCFNVNKQNRHYVQNNIDGKIMFVILFFNFNKGICNFIEPISMPNNKNPLFIVSMRNKLC